FYEIVSEVLIPAIRTARQAQLIRRDQAEHRLRQERELLARRRRQITASVLAGVVIILAALAISTYLSNAETRRALLAANQARADADAAQRLATAALGTVVVARDAAAQANAIATTQAGAAATAQSARGTADAQAVSLAQTAVT